MRCLTADQKREGKETETKCRSVLTCSPLADSEAVERFGSRLRNSSSQSILRTQKQFFGIRRSWAALAVAGVELCGDLLAGTRARQHRGAGRFRPHGSAGSRRTAGQGEVSCLLLDHRPKTMPGGGEVACNQNRAGRNAGDDHPQSTTNPRGLHGQGLSGSGIAFFGQIE